MTEQHDNEKPAVSSSSQELSADERKKELDKRRRSKMEIEALKAMLEMPAKKQDSESIPTTDKEIPKSEPPTSESGEESEEP